MTESRKLLEDYVSNDSESSFRELVARYLGLVYSTALRLVDGEVPLAEDVAQTVFVDLARLGGTLSKEVMLGGWLHRHTCLVARKAVRGERRRRAREMEAVEMNSLQDHSEANLAQVRPILDEAINKLGREDRAAILLRFFERQDFRSVGKTLGSTEDTAQKRVSRALEKLRSLLKHRGVTFTATALGAALAGEAATAAPAGLAESIAGTALASAASGGTTLSLLKIISVTKLKLGIISAIGVVGIGLLIWQPLQNDRLQPQNLAAPRTTLLSDTNEDFDLLRSFLQSPPELCSYAYEKTTHVQRRGRGKIAPQTVVGVWKAEETNWYQAIETTNALFAPSIGMITGRKGSEHWTCLNGDVVVYNAIWNSNAPASPTCFLARGANDAAHLLLRLGLPDIDFPSAVWEGANFRAKSGWGAGTTYAREGKVVGCIRRRSDGEWQISATNNETGLLENESIVRGHKGADGSFHPEEIELFALLKDKNMFGEKGWLKLQTVRVIRFRTEPRESPQNKFSPLEMPQIKLRAFTFYSNDVLYGFQPDATNIYVGGGVNYGAAQRIASMEEVARRMKPRNYYKWVLLILVVTAIISSILCVLRPMGHKQHSS